LSVGSSSSSIVAPRQLQQQDLHPGLLPTGQRVERLLTRQRQLVAVQRPGGLLAPHPVAELIAPMQDLEQRAPGQLAVFVGLSEPAGSDPGPEPGQAHVGHRRDLERLDRAVLDVGVGATAGQQAQEVRLARPVGAEHGHPLAEPDLEVERLHQPGQLQRLADHGPLCRSGRP